MYLRGIPAEAWFHPSPSFVGQGRMAFALRVPRVGGVDLRVRPLPLFYRSWGKGEWHSPYVYRGWEGQTYVSARLLPLSLVG